MSFKTVSIALAFLICLMLSGIADANQYSHECRNPDTNEAVAECNVMSKSPVIASAMALTLNVISEHAADILLNLYYGTDVEHFKSDKDNANPNKMAEGFAQMMALVMSVVSYIYLCSALIGFVKHLSHAAKNGEIAGGNAGFAMVNQSILFAGAGLSAVIYALCTCYLVGGYTATIVMNTVTPKIAAISNNESSTVYTSLRASVNDTAPVDIAKMVRVYISAGEVRQNTYASFATEWKNGVLVQKGSSTVVDAQGVSRTFNGFADCIKAPAGAGEMRFGEYVEPEFDKLQKCLGLHNTKYRTPLIAYHGESSEITDALPGILEKVKLIAQYTREVACTTGLNRNDRRNKYKDEPSIYAQCAQMTIDGSVTENGESVLLYNSNKTQADIDKLFVEAKDLLVVAELKYVEKLIANKELEVNKAVAYGDMITNAYSLFFKPYTNENEVNTKALEEFSLITVAADGSDTMNTNLAVLIGVSSQDTSAFDGREYRKNLINFDKVYEQTISPLMNQTTVLNNFAGVADMVFARGFYSNGGMNLKNCFKEGVECKTPIINQVSAQTHNGIVMVNGLIKTNVAFGLIKSGLEKFATNADRRSSSLAGKSEEGNIKAKALQIRSAKLTKIINTFQTVQTVLNVATAFFLFYLVIQSGYYIAAFVGQLIEWVNDFPKNVFGHSADMIKHSMNLGAEVHKTELIYGIGKRMGWSVFAPCLSVCLFFVNFGVLNLSLTIADSGVYALAGSASIADNDLIGQIYQIIVYWFIKALVVMGLSTFIIHQSSQIYKTVKKWFGVESDTDASQKGIEYIQKMEDKIRRRSL